VSEFLDDYLLRQACYLWVFLTEFLFLFKREMKLAMILEVEPRLPIVSFTFTGQFYVSPNHALSPRTTSTLFLLSFRLQLSNVRYNLSLPME